MVTKRIFMISYNPRVNDLPFRDTKSYMAHFRQNLGNQAFVYAASEHLEGSIFFAADEKLGYDYVAENFDIIVFPAANNLAEEFDLGWLADMIEGTGLPLLCFGLGIQAQSEGADIHVPEGTRRFLALVRDRSISLGVRGRFTQAFLEKHGVKTARIMGCPSLFINPDRALGQRISDGFGKFHNKSPIALNLEYFRSDATKVHVLTRLLRRNGGGSVLQSDEDVFSLLRDSNGPSVPLSTKQFFGEYFLGYPDVEEFMLFFRTYCRAFIHVPSWMDWLRNIDISLGTRYHGNALALQVGKPAFVFPHDLRTRELCETTKMPSCPIDVVQPGFALDDLRNWVQFDADEFDTTRLELARVYSTLIQEHDLVPTAALLNLASDFG